MLKVPYQDHTPEVKPGSYTAPNCTIVGNVTVEEKASMWYGSVTRADAGPIHIKKDDLDRVHPNFLRFCFSLCYYLSRKKSTYSKSRCGGAGFLSFFVRFD